MDSDDLNESSIRHSSFTSIENHGTLDSPDGLQEQSMSESRASMNHERAPYVSSTSEEIVLLCNACGFQSSFVPEGMLNCYRCGCVHYCSRNCMEWDWITGGHSSACGTSSAKSKSSLKRISPKGEMSNSMNKRSRSSTNRSPTQRITNHRPSFANVDSGTLGIYLKDTSPESSHLKVKRDLPIPVYATKDEDSDDDSGSKRSVSMTLLYDFDTKQSSNVIARKADLSGVQGSGKFDTGSAQSRIAQHEGNSSTKEGMSKESASLPYRNHATCLDSMIDTMSSKDTAQNEFHVDDISHVLSDVPQHTHSVLHQHLYSENNSALLVVVDPLDSNAQNEMPTPSIQNDKKESTIDPYKNTICSPEKIGSITHSVGEGSADIGNSSDVHLAATDSFILDSSETTTTDTRAAMTRSTSLNSLKSFRQVYNELSYSSDGSTSDISRAASLKDFRDVYNSEQDEKTVFSYHSEYSPGEGSIQLNAHFAMMQDGDVANNIAPISVEENHDEISVLSRSSHVHDKAVFTRLTTYTDDSRQPSKANNTLNQAKVVQSAEKVISGESPNQRTSDHEVSPNLQMARRRNQKREKQLKSALKEYGRTYGEDAAKLAFNKLTSVASDSSEFQDNASAASGSGSADRIGKQKQPAGEETYDWKRAPILDTSHSVPPQSVSKATNQLRSQLNSVVSRKKTSSQRNIKVTQKTKGSRSSRSMQRQSAEVQRVTMPRFLHCKEISPHSSTTSIGSELTNSQASFFEKPSTHPRSIHSDISMNSMYLSSTTDYSTSHVANYTNDDESVTSDPQPKCTSFAPKQDLEPESTGSGRKSTEALSASNLVGSSESESRLYNGSSHINNPTSPKFSRYRSGLVEKSDVVEKTKANVMKEQDEHERILENPSRPISFENENALSWSSSEISHYTKYRTTLHSIAKSGCENVNLTSHGDTQLLGASRPSYVPRVEKYALHPQTQAGSLGPDLSSTLQLQESSQIGMVERLEQNPDRKRYAQYRLSFQNVLQTVTETNESATNETNSASIMASSSSDSTAPEAKKSVVAFRNKDSSYPKQASSGLELHCRELGNSDHSEAGLMQSSDKVPPELKGKKVPVRKTAPKVSTNWTKYGKGSSASLDTQTTPTTAESNTESSSPKVQQYSKYRTSLTTRYNSKIPNGSESSSQTSSGSQYPPSNPNPNELKMSASTLKPRYIQYRESMKKHNPSINATPAHTQGKPTADILSPETSAVLESATLSESTQESCYNQYRQTLQQFARHLEHEIAQTTHNEDLQPTASVETRRKDIKFRTPYGNPREIQLDTQSADETIDGFDQLVPFAPLPEAKHDPLEENVRAKSYKRRSFVGCCLLSTLMICLPLLVWLLVAASKRKEESNIFAASPTVRRSPAPSNAASAISPVATPTTTALSATTFPSVSPRTTNTIPPTVRPSPVPVVASTIPPYAIAAPTTTTALPATTFPSISPRTISAVSPTVRPSPTAEIVTTTSPVVTVLTGRPIANGSTLSPIAIPMDQRLKLFSLLFAASLDGGTSLLVSGGPQNRAFNWLSSADNLFTTYSTRSMVQRFALATFYYSTGGESWSTSEGWLSDDDECTWRTALEEIPACNDDGIYINLDLAFHNLTGSIPRELALLSDLEELILASDGSPAAVTGSLPPEIGNMSNLKILDLSGNNLFGSIPSEFGALRELEYLDLSRNQLVDSIPSELGRLTSLKSFLLSANQLQGELPTTLNLLVRLEELACHNNALSGTIALLGATLPRLVDLNLEHNNFTALAPLDIADTAASPQQQRPPLQRLQLSHNVLTGTLPTTLGRLFTLERLALGSNRFTGPIPSEWFESSSSTTLARLTHLDLSDNQLTGTIPATLGSTLGDSLEVLQVQSNRLVGPLPDELGLLTKARVLRLEGNPIQGVLQDTLCDALATFAPTVYADCVVVVALEEDAEDVERDVEPRLQCPPGFCCTYCCTNGMDCQCQLEGTDLQFLCGAPAAGL